MTLVCSNNCLITRSNQRHVTPNNVLGNLRQFLMESNLKLSKVQTLHWMILGASPELIQQLLYRNKILANWTYRVCFGFCTHLIALSERDIPVIRRSELIKKIEWKPNVWNLSFLEMTPCLYTGVQHERV